MFVSGQLAHTVLTKDEKTIMFCQQLLFLSSREALCEHQGAVCKEPLTSCESLTLDLPQSFWNLTEAAV